MMITGPAQSPERYQLQTCLGQSVFANTYDALDTSTGLPVIVKELKLSHLDTWKNLELFQREARVLSQLNFPAIPGLLDAFESRTDFIQAFYLVQEKIPGHNLKQKFEQGWRPDEAQAQEIARQILDILIYLQSLSPPIVHRDLKPSNLILDPQGKVWLIDFGAVQELLKPKGGSTVVGTYGYMAPEQFAGKAVPASDLYSLGATLVHLLTGTAPADLPQSRLKLAFEDRIQTGTRFKVWLGKLLEPTLEKRLQRADAALQALQQLQKADLTQNVKAKPEVNPPEKVNQRANLRPSPAPVWVANKALQQSISKLPVTYQAEGLFVDLQEIYQVADLMPRSLPQRLLRSKWTKRAAGFTVLMSIPTLWLLSANWLALWVLFLFTLLVPLFARSVYLQSFSTELAETFDLTPFMLTCGKFFLPTHLIHQVRCQPTNSKKWTLEILWQAPPFAKNISTEHRKLLQAQEGSFYIQSLKLELAQVQAETLVTLINDWRRAHAAEIVWASKQRLDQAIESLIPSPNDYIRLSTQAGVSELMLDNGCRLRLTPAGLHFEKGDLYPDLERWMLPWNEMEEVSLITQLDPQPGEFGSGLEDCLSIRAQSNKTYHILNRDHASFPCPRFWIQDILRRELP